jgi:uncharacterized protein
MRIIDPDSHFIEPVDWLEKGFPKLAAQIPPIALSEIVAESIAGDAVASLPPSHRPNPADLFPEGLRATMKQFLEQMGKLSSAAELGQVLRNIGMQPPEGYDAEARIKWLDAHGIERQFLLPSLGISPYKSALRDGRRDLALEALAAYNTWATEAMRPHIDRLVPVCQVDLTDIQWAIDELKRARAAGSTVVQIRGEPAGDKSLAHPDFECFWSAVEDLGMIVMIHVGGGRVLIDGGWINNGGHTGDFVGLARLASFQVPQVTLAALLKRGVLQRHPGLRIVIGELGISWVPGFVEFMDSGVDATKPGSLTWEWPLKPGEYIQRQVRVTALGLGERLRPSVDRAPQGVIVFSSDYPHPEGAPDCFNAFERQLGDLDREHKEHFFGASMAKFLGV